ncbi:DUF3472 domain-containing protein [bacterium]|nr:MAG: DUF3472 domain-containing protein [bacterium]
MLPLLALAAPTILPVWTSYVEPNPEGAAIQHPQSLSSLPAGQTLVWYVRTTRFGAFDAKPVPAQPEAKVRIVGPEIGWKRIELTGALTSPLQGIRLQGVGSEEAIYNRFARRGTASVHLGYKQADGAEWVYQEATAQTDPIWTYYCAIGWHRGYFGFQVNSPTERRVIFSVWDAGGEAVDRDKVGDSNRVKLMEKGTDVVAGDFGNEGTGGHSHLVYPWKLGQKMRFLVHAQPQDGATLYSGWFWDKGAWRLMARMLAPKDGSLLKGIYSFDENFGDGNGQLLRSCDFGPVSYRKPSEPWAQTTDARFTIDRLGRERRDDLGADVKGSSIRLWTGGYRPGTATYGQILKTPAGMPPEMALPE